MFSAVLSIIWGFLMAVSSWSHKLQCIVIVLSFLRFLKLREIAICKLDLSRGGLTQCHGVLDHGIHFHRNIPFRGRLEVDPEADTQEEGLGGNKGELYFDRS